MSGCASPSARIVEQPAPRAVDPAVCAPAVEEPGFGGLADIVQPVTPEEQDAVQAFLNWGQTILDWGRQGWSRAETAQKSACH